MPVRVSQMAKDAQLLQIRTFGYGTFLKKGNLPALISDSMTSRSKLSPLIPLRGRALVLLLLLLPPPRLLRLLRLRVLPLPAPVVARVVIARASRRTVRCCRGLAPSPQSPPSWWRRWFACRPNAVAYACCEWPGPVHFVSLRWYVVRWFGRCCALPPSVASAAMRVVTAVMAVVAIRPALARIPILTRAMPMIPPLALAATRMPRSVGRVLTVVMVLILVWR